jgi:tRNA-Thr(GGU) m(6)t(6)A37 methyltransferase TsaA
MSVLEGVSRQQIGTVRSSLVRREDAPRQGFAGAPEAWLEIDPRFAEGLAGINADAEIVVLTWLHQAARNRLTVARHHRTGKPAGVFATRSPHRPNPIGLHRVTVVEVDGPCRLKVKPLEAIDGTPILDIKPAMATTRDD